MNAVSSVPVRDAVVLAAGNGDRFKNGSRQSKLLESVLGRPLILRTLATAAEAGISSFHIVVGYQAEKLRDGTPDGGEKFPGLVTPHTRCCGGVLVQEVDHVALHTLCSPQFVGTGDGCRRCQAIHRGRFGRQQLHHRLVVGGRLASA